MKKFIALLTFMVVSLAIQAQILTPVKWKISLSDSDTAEKTLVFSAKLDNGWHLYDMNLPEGGPVSTSFAFDKLEGAEVVGNATPSKEPTTVFDPQFNMELRWFAKEVTFTQKLKVTDPKKFKAEGYVEYMACNDENCLPPEQESFSFNRKHINVEKTLAALSASGNEQSAIGEEIAAADSAIETLAPSDETSEATPEYVEETPATPKALTSSEELWKPVIDELKAFGDTTVSATDMSLVFIFFAGFLGGLVALLTPCVWPMIPMTVSFFLKRTKNRAKAIRDALTYGLSIIVIYLVMGLLITGIFGASALNDLSTNAVFNIIFFSLFVIKNVCILIVVCSRRCFLCTITCCSVYNFIKREIISWARSSQYIPMSFYISYVVS